MCFDKNEKGFVMVDTHVSPKRTRNKLQGKLRQRARNGNYSYRLISSRGFTTTKTVTPAVLTKETTSNVSGTTKETTKETVSASHGTIKETSKETISLPQDTSKDTSKENLLSAIRPPILRWKNSLSLSD